MVYVFYAVTILFLLCSVRQKPNTADTAIFSKNDTLCLKGFAAIFVVFHHLGQSFSVPDPTEFNGYMGAVSVGIFYMLSAYGLTKANQRKGYYKRIFLQKIPRLYLYQVLINTLYYCLFFTQEYRTVGEVLPRIFNVDFLFGMDRVNSFSWFITSILVVYACFGVLSLIWEKVGEKCKNGRFWFAFINTLIIVLIYVVIHVTPMQNLYGRSIFCFAFGVWVATFEKEIMRYLRTCTYYPILFVFALAAVCVTFLTTEQLVAFATCLFTVVFFGRFSYPRSPIFEFLGKISLEIYLVQKIFFLCIPQENAWRDGVIIFAAVVLAAFLLKTVVEFVKYLTATLKNKAKSKKI